MKDKKKIIHNVIYIGVILLLLLAFSFIAEDIFEKEVFGVDIDIYNFAISVRNGFLTVFFTIITNLVHPITLAVITVAGAIFIKQNRQFKFAMFLNLAVVSILNFGLKNIFVRERPDEIYRLVAESGYSFPSGHSMMAMALGGFFIFLILRTDMKKWLKITLSIVISICILLVGMSRLYLGVHFFSDVVGGYLISGAYLMIYIAITKKYLSHKDRENLVPYKSHSLVSSFKYAVAGIVSAMNEERNLLIDFAATTLVILFGFACRISIAEWCICIFACGLVITLELFNTVVEKLCDRITTENDEKIKVIKDISAGAVLVFALTTIIIALIIFLPKLFVIAM